MRALQSEPHRTLTEDEGKNNCLTPKKLRLTIRTNDSLVSAKENTEENAAPSASTGGVQQRICVIVSPTGNFRMEKGRQEAAYKMNASVFEGAISEDELQALGQLLDATDLRNLHHQNQMSGTRMQEALVISLSIPREQETQQLLFSSYRNSGPHGEHAGAVIDDISLIQPLQKWLKASIENKKPAPVKSAKPNSCAPVL